MENKTIKIIALIAILIVAIGGPILSYKQQEKIRIEELEKYEEYEDDYDYEDEDYEEEYEDIITYLDPLVKNIKFTITEQDKEKLINSTNCEMCMSDVIIGEMFKENISDNFKLLYTVSVLTHYIDEEYPKDVYYGEMSIKQDTLLNYANQIWEDVEVPESFNINLYYYGVHSLSCSYGTCTFGRDTFGAMGVTPVIGYATNLTKENNNILVNKIYVKEDDVDYNSETEKATTNIKLYNDYNGTLIKELNSYELDLSKELNVYEEFSPYYENIPTYTYTFDDNNRLVSVETE